MAGKLSEIRASSPAATITGTELVEVTQSGATKAATVAEILGDRSLDGLSDVNTPGAPYGALLFRHEYEWRATGAGFFGQVLTSAGYGGQPYWADLPSGGGAGTVTSVALTAPSFLSVAGSPVTGAGTLALTLANQSANMVFAAPSGSPGAPTFRALASADIPGHPHPEAQRIGISNLFATAYTATVSDAGKMLRLNNTSAISLTIPAGAAFLPGDVIMVRQVNSGQITVSASTINTPTGVSATTRVQGSVMSLHYIGDDIWDVSGDLA